jgi:signal transduction histidine kinase
VAPITRQTWAANLYALASLPLAAVGFALVVATLAAGAGLVVTFVGFPLMALALLIARRQGSLYRSLGRRLLGDEVADPPPFQPASGFFGWLQSALRNGTNWRAVAFVVVNLPLAWVTLYAGVIAWSVGLFSLTYPLWWWVSPPKAGDGPISFGIHIGGWPGAVLVSVIGALILLAAPWVVRAPLWVERQLIRALLGPTGGSQRVQQLEAARTRLVDESASRLRRIERDLHDGTQAQLATLAMNLGQAKEKLEHDSAVAFDPVGALDLVAAAHSHAKEALAELRDIVRGIHPPVLDLGLDTALATLVARSAVPTTLSVSVSDDSRPSAAIETIAYFSVAELLANVARHSQAGRAWVDVRARGGVLRIQVGDDGIGGADLSAGRGLFGLSERVAAVDGSLSVSSPEGGPTVVSVELPLRA